MEESDLVPAPSHIIGPTWRRRKSGGWYLPQRSLGWAILNWLYKYVRQPSGPRAGEPFLPTDEQARWILWWYAVDSRGRFIYRKAVLRRLKGWGKDPIAACLALVELCGPVEFSHFDANGEPVGKTRSAAWVQVAAVSLDQTKNTMSLFPAMISRELRDDYGLDVNKTVIYTRAGGQIEAVTASPFALEGKRPTMVIKNETQWWVEANNGHAMAGVIAGNVDKAAYGGCRVLSICNAHVPGLESDAERDWDAYEKVVAGQAIDTGLLYDSIEAPPDTPVSEIPSPDIDPEGFEAGVALLRAGLEIARGDAVWLDIETLIASILDIRNPITESRRKFLNQILASEDSWIAPYEWDSCHDTALRPLQKKDRITLGFDGSKSGDWTALVACRVEDGALFLIKAWNPDRYGGEIPRADVDRTVEWVFGRYDVVAMRADVREFESHVDAWAVKYGRKLRIKATPKHAVAYDMRSNVKGFTLDAERFLDAVLEREVVHEGSPILRQHITNAHRRPNNHGVSIGKVTKDSDRKIDAAVCAVLAYGARMEFLMSKKGRGRRVVILK